MKILSPENLLTVNGGISKDCAKGMAAEFLAWAGLLCATTVPGAALALGGLCISPVLMAIACQNG